MKPLFVLARILGNETPPRDLDGGRLRALAELLREPPMDGVAKVWIINRVWDPALVEIYRAMLVRQRRLGRVHEIPFEPDRYFAADGPRAQLAYCPGVNHARNEAMRLGFEKYGARFAAAFDGDCGFAPAQWEEALTAIVGDAIDGVLRPAYSVPSIRIDHATWDAALGGAVFAGPREEPMLILSRRGWDSGIRFDESIPFGAGDKAELLVALGHDPTPFRQHEVVDAARCRSVAACCHLDTGPRDVEASFDRRGPARAVSLERLHTAIARHYRPEAP
jgi:hypothetical protein